MSRLSLCMIVRDEADMLPDFLTSIEGLWDELIVVDTGSRDQTMALLRAVGAQISEHPWENDFSAARNISLAAATGDWVLCLDADERPSPELITQIRDLLDDQTVGAATLRMRNHLPHGHLRESDLLRLWRRDPAIQFQCRIHETVTDTVTQVLERNEQRLVNLTGTCDHLGYSLLDRSQAASKRERDLQLLTASITDDDRDWYSWFKILEQARFWKDRTLWRDTAQQLVARLDGPPPADLPVAPWAGEMLALAALGLFTAPAEQIAWLNRWEPRVMPVPAFYLRRATAHEMLFQFDEAHRDFQRCRDLPPGTQPMLSTIRPLLGLCRLAAQRGDLLSAGDYVHQALAFNPRDPEALIAAVSFAWLNGGTEARDAFVTEHIELHGDSEELAMARGDHALQVGLWEDAVVALTQAAGTPPRGRAGLMLGQAMLGHGQVNEALELCRDLMVTLPEAGMGYLACSLVLGEEVEFSVDLEQHEADRALKEWIRVLWRSRQAPLMSAFIDHFPLVGELFPWLPKFLTDETEKLKKVLH